MVHFGQVRDLARKELVECLDQYCGKKLLVWDDSLTGPMDLIAGFRFLQEREVVRMLSLRPGRMSVSADQVGAENVVFIVRPDVKLMDRVAENIKSEESSSSGSSHRVEFHLLFIPRRSLLCEQRLKDRGVFGSLTFVDELPIHWFPLENDVVSMESSQVFRDYHLYGDPTTLHPLAHALWSLQALYGTIPTVYGKGRAARQVVDFANRMRKELVGAGRQPKGRSQIQQVVIIDRQIDLISPLVTQLTYEGLIDEMFGIRNASVQLPAAKFCSEEDIGGEGGEDNFEAANAEQRLRQIPLSSSEEMYAEIRDRHFNAVGPTLSKKAKLVSAQIEERHDAKTVKDLKKFVDRIPQMKNMKQSLATHTTIAEMIKERTDQRMFLEALQVEQELLNFQGVDRPVEYVEDATCQEEDLLRVLRVMCLQSVVNSGLKPKILDSYRRLILQSYGYKHLLSLVNLEKLGLLAPQVSSRNYAVLRKRLNLTLDDVDEQNPSDVAYVHSFYAPLSIRLIQHLSRPGWRSIRDVLDLLPGPTVEEAQSVTAAAAAAAAAAGGGGGIQNYRGGKNTTLVVFVGGCTHAEISALRFLSEQEDSSTNYLVATTSVINGDNFIKTLMAEVKDEMED